MLYFQKSTAYNQATGLRRSHSSPFYKDKTKVVCQFHALHGVFCYFLREVKQSLRVLLRIRCLARKLRRRHAKKAFTQRVPVPTVASFERGHRRLMSPGRLDTLFWSFVSSIEVLLFLAFQYLDIVFMGMDSENK